MLKGFIKEKNSLSNLENIGLNKAKRDLFTSGLLRALNSSKEGLIALMKMVPCTETK
jgi:hypothetical protein